MSRLLLPALLVFLLAAGPASARDTARMKRILSFQRANGEDAAARDLARRLFTSPLASLRFSATADDFWIVAGPDGALVDGKAYAHPLGGRVRIRIASNGTWAVAGEDGAIVDGRIVRSPETARILHDDLHRGRATRVGGQRSRSSAVAPSALAYRNGDLALPTAPLALDGGDGERVDVVKDVTPPFVSRWQLVRFPDDPARRRVVDLPAPDLFVGAEVLELVLTMSEAMGAAPRLEVRQNGAPVVQAGLTAGSQGDRIFRYRFFPLTQASANGPVALAALGERDGTPPDYGYDLAGNPLDGGNAMNLVARGPSVDTVPPDLRRVDVSVPGNLQSRPAHGEILAGHAFPDSILVFVADYDQADDGSFDGANLSTAHASGVAFENLGSTDSGLDLRLFAPDGRSIPGTLVLRQPALELLLPDVYDPEMGIFPDRDGDGRADPDEGNYRIEVDLVDRAGNRSTERIVPGLDGQPLPDGALALSVSPVYSTPFPNPANPIPATGTCVRRLEAVEVRSDDADWNPLASTARLLSLVAGAHTVPVEMTTTVEKSEDGLRLIVLRDQDGDGTADFENPEAGAYLPPGTVDPRWGKNDGLYRVEIDAVDRAGNRSTITRDLVVDTTPPQMGTTFPSADVTLGPPLRLVDAIVTDPAPTSGATAGGLDEKHFFVRLDFLGNDETPAQQVPGLAFLHVPNDSDPTQADYSPDDHVTKLLYEFVDSAGQVLSLPDDGSWDGVYEMNLQAWDRAGNEITGSVAFTYSSTAPSTPTTGETAANPVLRFTLLP